jgi:tetratricopeptide (TPR) repeat protein
MYTRSVLPAILVLILVLMFAGTVYAGDTLPAAILQAGELKDHDRPAEAIALLKPLLAHPDNLGPLATGLAWTVLGLSYENTEHYDEARRALETAVAVLAPLPDGKAAYAAALDDLGSVEGSLGNVEASRRLREQANRAYAESGDHDGLAITFSDLALNALERGDKRHARAFLEQAFHEVPLAHLDGSDLAALYSVKGSLRLHEGRAAEAIEAFDQAIRLEEEGHGRSGPRLGMLCALRAQAYLKMRDAARAKPDIDRALTLIAAVVGKDSPAYQRIELLHAQQLRLAGNTAEAAQVEHQSNSALSAWRQAVCAGCTVTAQSLR